MHGAPSVSYPVGRCRLAALGLGAAWLLAVAVTAAWALRGAQGWRLALAAGMCAFAGAGCAWSWWRSPVSVLRWDGAHWWLGDGPFPLAGGPEAVVDLQHWMLLRLPRGAGPKWLWLSRESAPSYWDALRRAVYCRAGTTAPQGGRTPAAPT